MLAVRKLEPSRCLEMRGEKGCAETSKMQCQQAVAAGRVQSQNEVRVEDRLSRVGHHPESREVLQRRATQRSLDKFQTPDAEIFPIHLNAIVDAVCGPVECVSHHAASFSPIDRSAR